jgi:hypothetical protein
LSNGGTRIFIIGIGEDVLEEENLVKISGPDIDTEEWDVDIVTVNFQDLSDVLFEHSLNLCGGVTASPHKTELPFFSFYHFLIAFLIIIIIYFFLIYKDF